MRRISLLRDPRRITRVARCRDYSEFRAASRPTARRRTCCWRPRERGKCPFCSEKHRLRRHGHYHRFVLLPGRQEPARVPIRRLLCARTAGRTVSLLPDFCLPRRQHGPEIVGSFLSAYAEGGNLLAALRAARPDAAGHSVAQSLRDGFLARAGPIRAYLARLRARAVVPPVTTCRRRREVAALLAGLCHGFAAAAAAFVHHGVDLHAMAQIGLA